MSGCEPLQIPTFDNVADFCGIVKRSGFSDGAPLSADVDDIFKRKFHFYFSRIYECPPCLCREGKFFITAEAFYVSAFFGTAYHARRIACRYSPVIVIRAF
mgnify:CR=1 FL=1